MNERLSDVLKKTPVGGFIRFTGATYNNFTFDKEYEVFSCPMNGKYILDDNGGQRTASIYLAFEQVCGNHSAYDGVNKRKGTLKNTGVDQYVVIWDEAESPDETVQQTVHKSESDIPGYDENVDGNEAFDILKDMIR